MNCMGKKTTVQRDRVDNNLENLLDSQKVVPKKVQAKREYLGR